MTKKIFYLFFVIFISGCATSSKPKISFPDKANIGYFNLVEDSFTHVHVGTLVFGNFKKTYANSWNVPKMIDDKLENHIRNQSNYSLTKLEPPESLIRYNEELYTGFPVKDELNPKVIPDITDLATKYGLHALIIIRTCASEDYITQSPVGLSGYGLYTRNTFLIKTEYVYGNINIGIFWLNPMSCLGGSYFKNESLPNFSYTEDLKNLSEVQLAELKPIFERKIEQVISESLADAHLFYHGIEVK